MTTATLSNTLRQGDLDKLMEVLKTQRARAFDAVVPASQIKVQGNKIVLTGIKEPVLFDDGVTTVNGIYVPTTVADEGISAKLDIPLPFLRKIRNLAPHLYEANVQGFLDLDGQIQSSIKNGRRERNFLLRLFRADDANEGVLRAFLSDEYKMIDNFDCLLAVLNGIKEAGIENTVIDADLTDRRMVVRVIVPSMVVYAEQFLKDYRNPFTGESAARGWTPDRLRRAAESEGHSVDDKVVFAGLVLTNSETGNGAFRITPRIVIGPCTNGLQLTAESLSKTHLGAKLDEGIAWSVTTHKANLDLITSQATDAVKTFLDVDFVTKQVEKLTEQAQEPVNNPQPVIVAVSKGLGFSEKMADDILRYFIKGGQSTVGGVMQAVTAAAQTHGDGDTALDMEEAAVKAMSLAHTENRKLAKV